MEDIILRAIKQELDDNHFDTQIAWSASSAQKHAWAIKVRDDDLTTYFVLIEKGIFKIHKRTTGNTGKLVFKAEMEHPKSVGAILSYLHRNCEFGRDVRNHLGFNPHRGPGKPFPGPQEKIGPKTAQSAES